MEQKSDYACLRYSRGGIHSCDVDSDERTDAKGGASLFDQHYQRANEYGTAAGI